MLPTVWFLVFLVAESVFASPHSQTSREISACIRRSACHEIFVAAHRGHEKIDELTSENLPHALLKNEETIPPLLKDARRQNAVFTIDYNFGVVYPEKLFRSKAPSKKFLKYLRDQYGLKIVIDLRNPNSKKEKLKIAKEQKWAKELGLIFVSWPAEYDQSRLAKWIGEKMSDPNSGSILIHCQAGRDRTGGAIAFLRLQDGWTYEEAREEMMRFGHKPEKDPEYHKYLREYFTLISVPAF